MSIGSLLVFLLIGGIAGWIAGFVTKGSGFGLTGNVVVGICGALLGGFLFQLLGFGAADFMGRLVMASFGSVVLLGALFLLGFNVSGSGKEAKQSS